MPSLNKAIVIGHLGQDPEVRYSQDGTPFATLSIATSFHWNDKQSGEKKEETEWHRINLRGKLAEVAEKYLKKGALCFVEGRIKTRKWQDKGGQDRYTTEIVGYDLKMLDRKSSQESASPEPEVRQEKPKADKPKQEKKPVGKFDDMEDDIPFD